MNLSFWLKSWLKVVYSLQGISHLETRKLLSTTSGVLLAVGCTPSLKPCCTMKPGHSCQKLLKFLHNRCVDHILWESVVYLNHGKYRSKKQGQLIPGFLQMTIQLFIVATGHKWMATFIAEWEQAAEDWVSFSNDTLVQQP